MITNKKKKRNFYPQARHCKRMVLPELKHFHNIKKEIISLSDAASQALVMGDAHLESKESVQLVDSSLVSGYLLSGKILQKESYKIIDNDVALIGDQVFSLYNEYFSYSDFHLGFSLPMVYELANSLLHIGDRVQFRGSEIFNNASLYDEAMEALDEDVRGGLVSQQKLLDLIAEVVALLPKDVENSNAATLKNMAKQKCILGLGSIFSQDEYNSVKDNIIKHKNKVYEWLNENRRRKIGESESAFNFRNLIDALNVAISYDLGRVREDTQMSFAGPFPSNRQTNTIKNLIADRTHPAALCLSLRANKYAADKAGDKKLENRYAYLSSFLQRANNCADYVRYADSVSQLDDKFKEEIYYFYEDHVKPNFGQTNAKMSREEAINKARELFTSPRAFKDRFREAGHELSQSADQFVGSIEPIMESDELLTDLGLIETPEVQRILNRKVSGPS